MDRNQRPHSREKKVGTGSAGVHTGKPAGTGGPVGTGGQGDASGRGSGTQTFRAGKKLSLKTILIIAAVAVVFLLVTKNMGGSGGLFSGLTDNSVEHINGSDFSYSENNNYSSYKSPNYEVSTLARKKYYTPLGNSKDTVTIMVYMCGTDLESKYGMGTKDIQEMLSATLSDKVNLIIETGGCNKWQNNVISSSKNQIYKIENGKLKCLQKDAGTAAMTDPNNLTSFIKYCEKNYPADRNMLIFWDHGGGSLSGYGYDEKHPSSSSMSLSKINGALKKANCKFDVIGFDACLMATFETALVCSEYADYLIGSEESEPGTGWYYKNWLTELASNTSVKTVDLAQTIIDDFISSCRSSGSTVTLSVVDLAELQGTVPTAFNEFSTSTTELIKSDDYKKVSTARANVRQFAKESRINQVDLIDLAQRIGTDEAKELAEALHGCVKYNQSTLSGCNGISIYFPYETTNSVKNAVASYEALGVDSEYTQCIKSFASLGLGGQLAGSLTQMPDISSSSGDLTNLLGSLLNSYINTSATSSSSSSPIPALLGTFLGGSTSSSSSSAGNSIDPSMIINLLGAFTGRSMPSELDWVDTQLVADNAKKIADNSLDPSRFTVTQNKDGRNILELTNDEWALVDTVALNVFVDDGKGYVDLGLDNTFEWDDDDNLLVEFDGTWLTLNGNTCAYYLLSDTQNADGSYTTIGYIPATLNGEYVKLNVVFDKENPYGVVTGAYPLNDNDADVQAKGDIQIKAGDKIQLLCDYYNTDGSYSDSYELGNSFTVPQSGLKLENLKLDLDGEQSVEFTYKITDIYGFSYWVKP